MMLVLFFIALLIPRLTRLLIRLYLSIYPHLLSLLPLLCRCCAAATATAIAAATITGGRSGPTRVEPRFEQPRVRLGRGGVWGTTTTQEPRFGTQVPTRFKRGFNPDSNPDSNPRLNPGLNPGSNPGLEPKLKPRLEPRFKPRFGNQV